MSSTRQKILKIALGDLRHRTIGRHSSLMPLGIGFISSYLKKQMGDKVELRLFEDPDIFLHEFDNWRPDVVGLTNFMWNTQLNRMIFEYAKERNPSIVCVAGGPQFPIELSLCESYLLDRECIDFYVYLEGELVFEQLIQDIYKNIDIDSLKSSPRTGILSIHPKKKTLVFAGPASRITDFTSIPSPYLSGIMDQWFDGTYSPSIQTARGCPYSCAYCRAGNKFYGKVVKFPLKRVKQEFTFIAERMAKYPSLALYIIDSNFGLFERDEEIADHIRSLQDKFGWPEVIILDTSKDFDRVLRMSEKVKKRMNIACSFQSLNTETLKIINRKNVNVSEYSRMQNEIKSRKMRSEVELIIPLPAETRESFMNAMLFFFSEGADGITPFTSMMLPGTLLSSKEMRKKYNLQTRFRIIPRQFGEYRSKKCFEIEEVCIATSTMSFDDYLTCRGFAFLCVLFADKQYDIIARHIKDLAINKYKFIKKLSSLVNSEKTRFSTIYNEFMRETREELYDSYQELFDTLNSPDNYDRLLRGEIGDNLVRKYRTKTLSEAFTSFVETAYKTLNVLVNENNTDEAISSLEEAKKWILATRNISELFFNNECLNKDTMLDLSYDVNKWYSDGDDARPLAEYLADVKYRMFYDVKHISNIIEPSKLIYGEDREFSMARTLLEHRANVFWRKCENVNMETSV